MTQAAGLDLDHLPVEIIGSAEELLTERVALSEVISALSFALDLTEDAVPGHAIRTCLIGMRIGTELGPQSRRAPRSVLRAPS